MNGEIPQIHATVEKRIPRIEKMLLVLNEDFPDPSVFFHDGVWYAHATRDRHSGQVRKIKGAWSGDLIHWHVAEEDALSEGPKWADDGDFWAPFTRYNEDTGKFQMFYAARIKSTGQPGEKDQFGISVAESDNPLTGFRDTSPAPIIRGEANGCIDPYVYTNDQGKLMLVWGSDGKPIREQELTPDGTQLAPGSSEKVLLEAQKDNPIERLVEGAYLDTHDGYTYLYYSGPDTFGNGSPRRGIIKYGDYNVMVARLNPQTGKFERRTDVDPTVKDNIILEGNEDFKNPGNNSIVHVGDRTFLFCHAIDRANPYFDEIARFNRRLMVMAEIVYKNGWPEVIGGRFDKTTSEQAA